MFTIFAFALIGVVAVALIGCVGGGIGGSGAETRERRKRMLSARTATEKLKDAVVPGTLAGTAAEPVLDGASKAA